MSSTARFLWEAPRWAKTSAFLKNQAFMLGLECRIEVDKGLIRETGRCEVSGGSDACQEFLRRCNQAMREFNQ